MPQSRTSSENQDDTRANADLPSSDLVTAVLDRLAGRPIVLVGMMGAGKTTVGRRLATALKRRFIDSDAEIEVAAGMSIPEFFETHGEAEFRSGETRVIARLIGETDIVLGTGGGAFMNEDTRRLVREGAVSVWLKADLETLFERVSRRGNRPLLKTANPRQTLKDLMDTREPVYAKADLTIESRDIPHEAVAREIVQSLANLLSQNKK